MASAAQSAFTPAQINTLNELGTRAGQMLYKLAQKPPASGQRVAEVVDFQHEVNLNKSVFQASIVVVQPSWQPSGYSSEIFGSKGLAEDGIWGPRTATAFALVLFSRGVSTNVLATIPTRGSDISLWYAANRNIADNALLPVVIAPDVLPPEAPAPEQESASQIVDEAKAPPEVVMGPAEDIQFESGSNVLAPRPEKASNVPLIALGVGGLVVGGFILYTLRKKKGR